MGIYPQVCADGTLERYKARLVAKGFTQTYGVDYFETFSPVARLNSIRVLFSLAVNLSWPMYQMDIKNAFLYGDLNETVYMEQPPGYVAQGEKQRMVCKLKKAIYGLKQSPRAWFDKFSRIIGEFGFSRCQADHSVFVQTTTSGMVVLAVYVDDILITGSDLVGIEEAKTYLQKHFVTKDLGRPRPDISFAVGLVSQFMDKPRLVHWEAALRILNKKQTTVARSSAEAEYRAMAHTTSEILWLKNLLKELVLCTMTGPFAVVDEHLNTILPNCFDAIVLAFSVSYLCFPQLIMSRRRIPCLDSYLDKVNISLWPRFKMVFDMHLNSLRNANVRTLWEDDVHPHYVMRRYAEFTASLIQLNVDYGDGQLELNLERLRMAVDDLLVKLAKLFRKPKLQTEELLVEHFSDLIKFVKTRASEDPSSSSERPITVTEVEPIVKDFASRWKAAIELMHNDVITSFSNFLCGMEILRAALTQLLLYSRLSDCMKRMLGVC
ncbi:Vacuolar protein sorting-associated protein 52 A [Sesamum angolense]|uniref:Vacuolar protein sorting-associated protein 52 A n=1 Tax=Sesamum angolense TaxID=2727404 RepID=A0AAE2C0P2_9LAMI|nr:Vacuolar protein sorting-associated protein 52 A [Sesamum angolense]